MKRTEVQLELVLPTRHAVTDSDDAVVEVRVPKHVAQAVESDPAGAVKHLESELTGRYAVNVEAFIGYTPWREISITPPPCSGYWDATAQNMEHCSMSRMWYDAGCKLWSTSPEGHIQVTACVVCMARSCAALA